MLQFHTGTGEIKVLLEKGKNLPVTLDLSINRVVLVLLIHFFFQHKPSIHTQKNEHTSSTQIKIDILVTIGTGTRIKQYEEVLQHLRCSFIK